MLTRLGLGVCALAACFAVAAPAGAAPGSLTYLEHEQNGVSGVSGIGAAMDVAVSPDGKNVYVAGSSSNGIGAFTRDPAAGTLTFLASYIDGSGGVDGIDEARGIAISPDGLNVYVTGYDEDSIATFTRNPATGALTYVEKDTDGSGGVDGIDGAWGVAVSPNGANVYVTGDFDNAIATFTRNPSGGALTFLEADKDGVGPVDGLSFSTGVAVSPDGASVYGTGCGDNAVAALARNSGSGALTFVEREKEGVGGVTGIACARGVAVSPDGGQVYVVGESSDAIATFGRDAGTSALSFQSALVDGSGGVTGLNGVRDVAVAADGGGVYTASTLGQAVTSFTRNAAGALGFLEVDKDGVDGVDGLNYATAITVSPASDSAYAASEGEDSVVAFSREPNPIIVPPGSAAQTITLSAKKKVKKGKKVKLKGTVGSTDPACVASQVVRIERKTKKQKAFKPLRTLTSNGSGAFSTKQKLKKATQFRAVIDPGASCDGVTSATKKVKVKKKKPKK